MKIVVAMTGASGAIYTQRLLDNLDPKAHEIHFISTKHAREVGQLEFAEGRVEENRGIVVIQYDENGSMFVPFVSGSAKFDAMVIIPASMGTVIGRVGQWRCPTARWRAHHADVFLKERRKPLIVVPRESP